MVSSLVISQISFGSLSMWSTDHVHQTSAQHQSIFNLSDISNIERTDLKPYCLLLETKDKRVFFSLKNDEELYGWQDDIYSRSPLMGVSNPTNFVHKVHVGFDPVSGAFTVSFVFGKTFSFTHQVHRGYRTRGVNC